MIALVSEKVEGDGIRSSVLVDQLRRGDARLELFDRKLHRLGILASRVRMAAFCSGVRSIRKESLAFDIGSSWCGSRVRGRRVATGDNLDPPREKIVIAYLPFRESPIR
jgi:hypothetical protein